MQHVPLVDNAKAPAEFFQAVQEMLSGAATNFRLTQTDATHLQVPAGTGDQQASLAIGAQGAYRWITAAVTGAHPGGAAGIYDVFATAEPNRTTPLYGPTTTHAFALAILATGTTPSGSVVYRKVGFCRWNGSAITQFTPSIGPGSAEPGIPIGTSIEWDGSADPSDARFLLRDGRLLNSSDYPQLDALCGAAALGADKHKYNGGVDPGGGKFRLGDRRGRVGVAPDNMGTATGAASRATAVTAGAGGGEAAHALLASESGVPAHAPAVSVSIGPQLGNILGDDGNSSGTNFGTNTSGGPNVIKRQPQYGVTAASASVSAANAAASHNIMQPYEGVPVITRVK